MKWFRIVQQYKKSYARKTVVESKSWFLFQWQVILIIALGFFAALLNQIPNWVIVKLNGQIDPIHSYPLRNNIIYSSFAIFIIIGISIFIGVFTEMGRFAGKYGSAIFILVPSFVWLLTDRTDNHIENILNTAKLLGNIIFWLLVAMILLFAIMTAIIQIFATFAKAYKTKLRIEFIHNYINRFNILIVNVLIVLMLGYAFINYGIFSLNLANNTPTAMAANPNLGPYDLHSESFTIYIALVAVFFALLMVVIGLTHVFFMRPNDNQIYMAQTNIYLDKNIYKHDLKSSDTNKNYYSNINKAREVDK